MSVRRALVATVLAPLVGLALAGCQETEPSPKMPATSAASPTPTETATAEQETPEEFIRRWAEVEAAMENSGDTAEYRELSKACQACTDLADMVEDYYQSGGYVKWDGWRVLDVKPWTSGTKYAVKVQSAPTTYRESAEGPVKSFPGGPGQHLLTLTRKGNSWLVVDKAEIAR